jgi:putative membrane protein
LVLRLIIRLLINALAVWVASRLITGITPLTSLTTTLAIGLIFGIVNALIKPIFSLISLPIQVLTLGLFTLVINAAMLGITSWLASQLGVPFAVDGFAAAFLGALVISLVSWALSSFL